MQHRYWRAAEPDRFRDELSLTDQRFFDTVAERKAYEQRFADWIERSLIWTDGLLEELLELVDDDVVLVIGTALGQKPHDPVHEIHNPVVRLVHEGELFAALGFPGVQGAHADEPRRVDHPPRRATRPSAPRTCSAACTCIRAGPCSRWNAAGARCFSSCSCRSGNKGETLPPIRHATLTGFQAPFERHVHEHPTNDQSTAQHDEPGFLLAYCAGRTLEHGATRIPVTDIAPTILSWFGIGPAALDDRGRQARDRSPLSHAVSAARSAGRRIASGVAAMPKRERLAAIAFGLKLAITLGLFAYLLRKVELAPVLGQIARHVTGGGGRRRTASWCCS